MSDKFINIRQTTDVAELQETITDQRIKIDGLRGRIKYLEGQLNEMKQLCESQQSQLAYLQNLVAIQEDTLSMYNQLASGYASGSMGLPDMDDDGDVIGCGVGPSGSHLTHGIGLSYSADEGSKLYRVSDPDGPLIPNIKFKKAELEIGHGQGIHFGLHWDHS